MLLFYLAYFALLLETCNDNENPRVCNRASRKKNMQLSEKAIQRYREFYCCNPGQITPGHHSEHRPLAFSMYFLPYFPSPQSLVVSKETIQEAQIFRHTQH